MSLGKQSAIYLGLMIVWAVFCGLARVAPEIHCGVMGLIAGWYLFTPTHPSKTKDAA